jgi:CubicO group peptidase (beta-lactamase class C family)
MLMKKVSLYFFVPLLFIASCKIPVRSVYKLHPGNKDYHQFENKTIKKGENSFSFIETDTATRPTFYINDETTGVDLFNTLDQSLEGHNNTAFIVIQNDSIIYERYTEGYDTLSFHPSYSVAKSFTSALLGIAIDEEFIKDENELAVSFISELEEHPEAATLTLKHLLNHTSGLKVKLNVDANLYYGNDIWKGIKQIEFQNQPGERQYYCNVNTQLLGIVIERATKTPNYTYLQEKIWKPLGMESDALWSVDKKNNITKSYCCLMATARDFAKLGRLYLNMGNWNGEQIVSEEWVKKSTARDNSDGSSYGYNYAWQIGLKEYGDYRAAGLYEQYIYVYPRKNLVIASFNDREKKLKYKSLGWIDLFRQIGDQVK